MKKLIVILLLATILLGGCVQKSKVIITTKEFNPVKSYDELEAMADFKVRVKILDHLTTENSTLLVDSENKVQFFTSERKVKVIEDYKLKGEDDSAMTIESIYHSEAMVDQTVYITESTRSLEEGKEYIVFLQYSEDLERYSTIENEADGFEN